MTKRNTKLPSSIDEDLPTLQLNTRISLRVRRNLDEYLDYIQTNVPRDLPPETSDWPRTLTSLVNEALEIWLAEHPRRFRKGPNPDKLVPKKEKK